MVWGPIDNLLSAQRVPSLLSIVIQTSIGAFAEPLRVTSEAVPLIKQHSSAFYLIPGLGNVKPANHVCN